MDRVDNLALIQMLQWIQNHGVAVEMLVVKGSPWTEAALTALLSCAMCQPA